MFPIRDTRTLELIISQYIHHSLHPSLNSLLRKQDLISKVIPFVQKMCPDLDISTGEHKVFLV